MIKKMLCALCAIAGLPAMVIGFLWGLIYWPWLMGMGHANKALTAAAKDVDELKSKQAFLKLHIPGCYFSNGQIDYADPKCAGLGGRCGGEIEMRAKQL